MLNRGTLTFAVISPWTEAALDTKSCHDSHGDSMGLILRRRASDTVDSCVSSAHLSRYCQQSTISWILSRSLPFENGSFAFGSRRSIGVKETRNAEKSLGSADAFFSIIVLSKVLRFFRALKKYTSFFVCARFIFINSKHYFSWIFSYFCSISFLFLGSRVDFSVRKLCTFLSGRRKRCVGVRKHLALI